MWSEAPESMIHKWLEVVTETLKVEAEVPDWAKNEVRADEEDSRLAIKQQSYILRETQAIWRRGWSRDWL